MYSSLFPETHPIHNSQINKEYFKIIIKNNNFHIKRLQIVVQNDALFAIKFLSCLEANSISFISLSLEPISRRAKRPLPFLDPSISFCSIFRAVLAWTRLYLLFGLPQSFRQTDHSLVRSKSNSCLMSSKHKEIVSLDKPLILI